jgi:hypothetical protein
MPSEGLSAWMRANSGWLFGLLGVVGVGSGFSLKPAYESYIDGIRSQGYVQGRKELRTKLDSISEILVGVQLDAMCIRVEHDMCCTESSHCN